MAELAADGVSGTHTKLLRCSRCGAEKPAEGFAVDRSRRSGRKGWCKDCDNARCRRYYRANREKVIARVIAAQRAKKPSAGPPSAWPNRAAVGGATLPDAAGPTAQAKDVG